MSFSFSGPPAELLSIRYEIGSGSQNCAVVYGIFIHKKVKSISLRYWLDEGEDSRLNRGSPTCQQYDRYWNLLTNGENNNTCFQPIAIVFIRTLVSICIILALFTPVYTRFTLVFYPFRVNVLIRPRCLYLF